MKPVSPVLPGVNLEANGLREITIAKDQPPYNPLPAVIVGDAQGTVITRWELTEEELKRIAETKCFYITQLRFSDALQPLLPAVDIEITDTGGTPVASTHSAITPTAEAKPPKAPGGTGGIDIRQLTERTGHESDQ